MALNQTEQFKRAVLLLPGAVNFDLVRMQYAQWLEDSLIIAVDKGIEKASFFAQGADLWVGDFDSSRHLEVDLACYGEKIPYPEDKDEIDTELAIGIALEKGVQEILLLGGIGGRLDHQTALLFLPFQYPNIAFTHSNGEQTLTYLQENQEYTIPTQKGGLVSVIALTKLSGLTLQKVKWPLDNFTLPLGRGLTYSNRALGDEVLVEITQGHAWLYNVMPEIDESL
ncbi:thiamine diphosphokinase [Ignatzschineria rhizosphaerae]|uniref:Thiamine diphosphokinase n=1 Tax=Ignatzschineria rhizosphaerae TaxID=2923279 RepID=A0ABY3X6S2_9GAMM|nr:thiamine diphosphokinase [Ignatzschineria rhizosphaerae]UNM97446.1 thiamine diphosphokinase [Ignatzschineria rhizosphaerae]